MKRIENQCRKKIKELGLPKEYTDRLNEELVYVALFDLPDYIINLQKLIKTKKERKRVNANGLVYAWLMGLTDSDPIKENIPHNKFLSDPPDVDVDMSNDAKEQIEKYLVDKHGADKVLHIYTVSLYKPKATIRSLCRTMSLTGDMAIIKEITEYFGADGDDFKEQIKAFMKGARNLSAKTQKFLASKPEFTKLLPREDKGLNCGDLLFKYALMMVGQVSHTGKHASGVAIAAEPFADFAPTKKVKGEILLALQEGMTAKEVTEMGCLKYDWLAIVEQDKIRDMFVLIEELYGKKGLHDEIVFTSDFDDEKTIDVFNSADTTGVFQFGSVGMKQCLKQANITSFNDIMMMNAIYRPGSLSYLDTVTSRMRNPLLVEYDHPDLEPVLKDTYGVPVYQEQVMQIMSVVGGLTLSEADKARGILKKLTRNKNPDKRTREYYEYQQLLKKFQTGAAKKGYTKLQAEKYVKTLADSMGYSFNRCLHPDTIIAGCDKKIKDVKIGDKVEVYDTKDKKVVGGHWVTNVYKSKKQLFKVKTASGKELVCSMDHKIMCEDGKMRSLQDILKGKYKILMERKDEKDKKDKGKS